MLESYVLYCMYMQLPLPMHVHVLLLSALTVSLIQRHQLNILLQGFSDRNEFVGLIYEGRDKESKLNPYTDKLHALCRRMISYLHFSVVCDS